MENQLNQILKHLQDGHSITGIEALNACGCFRLPARIYDLKRLGHNIHRDIIKLASGKKVAKYTLLSK